MSCSALIRFSSKRIWTYLFFRWLWRLIFSKILHANKQVNTQTQRRIEYSAEYKDWVDFNLNTAFNTKIEFSINWKQTPDDSIRTRNPQKFPVRFNYSCGLRIPMFRIKTQHKGVISLCQVNFAYGYDESTHWLPHFLCDFLNVFFCIP